MENKNLIPDENNDKIQKENVVDSESVAKETEKESTNKEPQKKKKSHKLLIAMVCVMVFSVVLSVAALSFISEMTGFFAEDKEQYLIVDKGSSVQMIAEKLEELGVIDHPLIFRLYSKYRNADKDFQYGLFILNNNMSYDEIINELKQIVTKRESVKVTVPEGYTINQIAELLEKNNVCTKKDFLKAVNETDYGFWFEDQIKDSDIKYYKKEGFIYPDTYEFYTNDSAQRVAKAFFENFSSKITEEIRGKIQASGLTLEETIILASIIQAEAADVADMSMVSSVYWNRLNNKAMFPRLESCPTERYVNYEIIPDMGYNNESITGAYNTYIREGLPEGAICNPGIDAILAALNPAQTDYYFFCANLDTKQVYYGRTLAEHNANLKKAGLS